MQFHRCIVAAVVVAAAVTYAFQPGELQRQADAFLEQGRFLEALSTYDILTGEGFAVPRRAQAFLRKGGILLLFLDDYEGAEKSLKEAIRLDPDGALGARAYFRLGMQYHQQSRYAEAADAFRNSLEREPGGVNAPTAEFLLQQSERLARLGITSEPDSADAIQSHSIFPGDTDLRIAVARDVPDVRLTADTALEVMEPGGTVVLRSDDGSIHIENAENGMMVNGTNLDQGMIGIRSDGMKSITCNEFILPSGVKIEKTEQGMVVVARIPVEEYLRGVVPREMPASWPEEALKAQAVCARTYALYQKKRRADYPYDLLATVASQVYGGEGSYHPRTDSAIESTRDMVLLYDGNLALTLFHSCSGGYTEDMKRVWGSGLPYLEGVEDPHSPAMEWSCDISLKELKDRLQSSGISCTGFSSLAFNGRGPSGRYSTATVGCGDESMDMRADKLRHILGPSEMRSTRISDYRAGSSLQLTGEGFGHGVGLSQWGARNLAMQGAVCDEILTFYYPDTTPGIIKRHKRPR